MPSLPASSFSQLPTNQGLYPAVRHRQGETTAGLPSLRPAPQGRPSRDVSPLFLLQQKGREHILRPIPQSLEVELALTVETKQLVYFQMPIRVLADRASEKAAADTEKRGEAHSALSGADARTLLPSQGSKPNL